MVKTWWAPWLRNNDTKEMTKKLNLISSSKSLNPDMLESYLNWKLNLLISMGLEDALWEWWVT